VIGKNDLVPYILSIEPDFKSAYLSHLEFMNNQSSLHLSVSCFSQFVADKLASGSYQSADTIFSAIESLLTAGNSDEDVKNPIFTCFLESLINLASNGHIAYETFVPLIGPNSREYCKAWDKFTGVKTPSLWD
jgi:hypothetical protein